MRLAIVRGHRASSQGATAVDGLREYAWATALADSIADRCDRVGVECRIFTRPDRAGYTSVMRELVQDVNRWTPDIVVSLHFNAAAGEHKGIWNGTYALHWPGSSMGQHYATRIASAVASTIGTRLIRGGAMAQGESAAGYPLMILRDTAAPAVILESHFGDHPTDHMAALRGLRSGQLARAIVEAVQP